MLRFAGYLCCILGSYDLVGILLRSSERDGVSNSAYCLACQAYSIRITPVTGCHAVHHRRLPVDPRVYPPNRNTYAAVVLYRAVESGAGAFAARAA